MAFRWYSVILVIICVIVFVLQLNYGEPFHEEFMLISSELFTKPWMLITHIFLHGDGNHLIYNMLALGLFGSILEKIIGGKRFLFIFFASGIIAGIGSFLFYEASLGASGAVMGILGTLGVLRPRMTVYVSYIPMPMSIAVIFWALGDLFGFFVPYSNVAHIAHLAGLATGLVYGLKLKKRFGMRYPKKIKYYEIGERDFEKWEDSWL